MESDPLLLMLQVLIAESYGGDDEPVDTLTGSMIDISVQNILEPLRIKETPTQATYQACHHFSPLKKTLCLECSAACEERGVFKKGLQLLSC